MIKNRLKLKRGSEAVETILVLGIVISVIIVVFYPQLKSMLNVAFTNLENWFSAAVNSIT